MGKKTIKERVYEILETNLEARDNHLITVAIIWEEDIGADTLQDMTAIELLDYLRKDKLTKVDSVRKISNSFEKIKPENQGSTYHQRMRKYLDVAASINAENKSKYN